MLLCESLSKKQPEYERLRRGWISLELTLERDCEFNRVKQANLGLHSTLQCALAIYFSEEHGGKCKQGPGPVHNLFQEPEASIERTCDMLDLPFTDHLLFRYKNTRTRIS